MVNTYSCDLYFVGIKKSDKQIFDFKISELEAVCAKHQDQIQKRKKSEKLIPKPFRPAFRKIHKFFVKNSVHNDLIDRA
jgi:hypothetical protein